MAAPPKSHIRLSLKAAPWLASPSVKHLFGVLGSGGGDVRVIGGAVRNALMGLPVSDIDLATDLLPEAVIALCLKSGLAVYPTGLEHGPHPIEA